MAKKAGRCLACALFPTEKGFIYEESKALATRRMGRLERISAACCGLIGYFIGCTIRKKISGKIKRGQTT